MQGEWKPLRGCYLVLLFCTSAPRGQLWVKMRAPLPTGLVSYEPRACGARWQYWGPAERAYYGGATERACGAFTEGDRRGEFGPPSPSCAGYLHLATITRDKPVAVAVWA
jgi:hypothetical protein